MLAVFGALLLFGQVVPAIVNVYWLGFMGRRYFNWVFGLGALQFFFTTLIVTLPS